ncbi:MULTISPECIES: hypothetical protein [Pseudomonas]|uniref:hypothetical protein n=1 Tax=Pseudomonas TaxID=286 RepID=UPI00030F655B|nr:MULTISPECIES: hypothetical protein [Pseudomonas]AIG02411.1 hypothetical protein HZ99_09695 [Pseudomonas fluorescens]CDF95886.1 hypothetical protein BN844_2621 [Pseudomonas sp. SHC52]
MSKKEEKMAKAAAVAHLVEMDDLNLDSSWLTASRIRPLQLPVGSDPGASIEHLIYGSGLDSFVLDIGGNETASKTITAIGEQMLLRHFDLTLIPVRDEGQDVDNAFKTIKLIREFDKQTPIAILLNDITSRTQDTTDLALREAFAEVFDLAEQTGTELLVMPRIERYGRSRRIGLTQWEISEEREAIADRLRSIIIEAEQAGDLDRAKLNTRLMRAVTGSKTVREMINVVFKRLDQILGQRDRLRMMVVSTKGGVGKSFTSQQLIAPYLLYSLGGRHE